MVYLIFMRRGSGSRLGWEQEAFVLSGNRDAQKRVGQVLVPYLPWHSRASGPSPRWQPKGGMNNRRAGTGLPATGLCRGAGGRGRRGRAASGGTEALGAGLTLLEEASCVCTSVTVNTLAYVSALTSCVSLGKTPILSESSSPPP